MPSHKEEAILRRYLVYRDKMKDGEEQLRDTLMRRNEKLIIAMERYSKELDKMNEGEEWKKK